MELQITTPSSFTRYSFNLDIHCGLSVRKVLIIAAGWLYFVPFMKPEENSLVILDGLFSVETEIVLPSDSGNQF